MLYGIIEAFFGIIKLIWNAPFWLVVVVIIIFSILYFIGMLFGVFDESDSSSGTGYGASISNTYVDKIDSTEFGKVEQPLAFYDYRGNRCGRGDCFYDSNDECIRWGDGFCDGEGYDRDWGESYYDAQGIYRQWGDCFYDAQGNLVYPD